VGRAKGWRRIIGGAWRSLAIVAALAAVVPIADVLVTTWLREVRGRELWVQHRAALKLPRRSLVVDRTGQPLGRYEAPEAQREPLERLPENFVEALVRWEDARFRKHDGVDRVRLLGAFTAVVNGDPQGGSTLTMQLAKLLKKDDVRTLQRKLDDVALALVLDERLGKEAVLLHYADAAYFGRGAHGLGAACVTYFDRPKCVGLALHEAAYLVALLRAPTELSGDAQRLRRRRDAVLERLTAQRVETWRERIDAFVRETLLNEPDPRIGRDSKEIAIARAEPLPVPSTPPAALHPFLLERVRPELEKLLGPGLHRDGFEVRLSIDAPLQRAAEEALSHGLAEIRRRFGAGAADDLDGSVVVLDPVSGLVRAHVAGADFHRSQVPFSDRPMQVGSVLKPFVYAELIEQRGLSPDARILDAPLCLGRWCPQNYDHKYRGPVPLSEALARSLNTAAVRAARDVGVDALMARWRLLGVRSAFAANLPMALGAGEVTLTEVATMFAALHRGEVVRPRVVTEVLQEGRVVWRAPEPEAIRGYRSETAEAVRTMLRGVVEPGGTAAAMGRRLKESYGLSSNDHLGDKGTPLLACKTGTHDSFTRAGMACLLGDSTLGPLVVVAYVGHRTPRPLGAGATGAPCAGPILERLIRAVAPRTQTPGPVSPTPRRSTTPSVSEVSSPPPAWQVTDVSIESPIQELLVQGRSDAEIAGVVQLVGGEARARASEAPRLFSGDGSSGGVSQRALVLMGRLSAGLTATRPERGRSVVPCGERCEEVVTRDRERTTRRAFVLPVLKRLRLHREAGRLSIVEWTGADGQPRAALWKKGRAVMLEHRRIVVRSGSLEKAWLSAGLPSTGLDELRAMLGGQFDIARIPRGFELLLLRAGGELVRVEARGLRSQGEVSAVRSGAFCACGDGQPCSRRRLPVTFAEARVYGPRGATPSGNRIVQQQVAHAPVSTPVAARVLDVLADRHTIELAVDGQRLRLEGLAPSVEAGAMLVPGQALGRVDARGVLVTTALERSAPMPPMVLSLPPSTESDAALLGLARRWREIHRHLALESP
jgi:penicillin-binding protein 1A